MRMGSSNGPLGKDRGIRPEEGRLATVPGETRRVLFVANDLTGESKAVKRRSTFISLIGPEPYKLLRSLLSPEKPKDKTFEELAAVLTKH